MFATGIGMRRASLVIGAGIMAASWLGLADLARESFAAHMTVHIALVAVAAPLVALALAGTAADPVRLAPALLAPIPASMIELVVVWGWHAPALHQAARQHSWVFAAEQISFVAAGIWLWLAAIGGDREQRRMRAGAGIAALLLTSMHMTLLGALFALAGRPLFSHAPPTDGFSHTSALRLTMVADQQVGGVIMLLVGGASYMAGALFLTLAALGSGESPAIRRRETTT
jgi:putative membrane protein